MPPYMLIHPFIGLTAIGLVLGALMRTVIGGPPKYLRFHRFNPRLLVIVALVTLALGVATALAMV